MRNALITLLTAMALGLAACGDDEESSEAETTVTPETAITEIAAVRDGLDEAVAAYESGDDAGAAETVNETYLQHFELVEGPLEEADEELNEELEEQIREELVSEIESGAPQKEIDALVSEIESGLEEAEEVLAAT